MNREEAIARRVSAVPVLYRSNYIRASKGKASPRNAIKAQCLECMGWKREEVTACTAPACPLWAYRPFQSGR